MIHEQWNNRAMPQWLASKSGIQLLKLKSDSFRIRHYLSVIIQGLSQVILTGRLRERHWARFWSQLRGVIIMLSPYHVPAPWNCSTFWQWVIGIFSQLKDPNIVWTVKWVLLMICGHYSVVLIATETASNNFSCELTVSFITKLWKMVSPIIMLHASSRICSLLWKFNIWSGKQNSC